jgi:uncharacterized protein with PIN domain
MIVCRECETADWLHITHSKVRIGNSEFLEVEEKYKCTRCAQEGWYWQMESGEQYSGIAESTRDLPCHH